MRATALGLVLGAGALSGCNVATPVFFLIHGPPKVDKITTLSDRPTVIFIDDRRNTMPRRSLRNDAAKTAEQIILTQKLLSPQNMISSQAAFRSVSNESSQAPVSVVDVGRRVGAEVVIYVEMYGWTLSREGGELSPGAIASVKILDTVTNTRLWPAEPEGWSLRANLPTKTDAYDMSRAERSKVEQQLAVHLGRELAGLFYTRERSQLQDQRPGT